LGEIENLPRSVVSMFAEIGSDGARLIIASPRVDVVTYTGEVLPKPRPEGSRIFWGHVRHVNPAECCGAIDQHTSATFPKTLSHQKKYSIRVPGMRSTKRAVVDSARLRGWS
jgi:hypothetical protein